MSQLRNLHSKCQSNTFSGILELICLCSSCYTIVLLIIRELSYNANTCRPTTNTSPSRADVISVRSADQQYLHASDQVWCRALNNSHSTVVTCRIVTTTELGRTETLLQTALLCTPQVSTPYVCSQHKCSLTCQEGLIHYSLISLLRLGCLLASLLLLLQVSCFILFCCQLPGSTALLFDWCQLPFINPFAHTLKRCHKLLRLQPKYCIPASRCKHLAWDDVFVHSDRWQAASAGGPLLLPLSPALAVLLFGAVLPYGCWLLLMCDDCQILALQDGTTPATGNAVLDCLCCCQAYVLQTHASSSITQL